MKDYYSILNVNLASTPQQIRQNYKKLAFLFHPDKSDGENKKTFISLTEAYKVLSDPVLSVLYYKYGMAVSI